MQEAFISLLSCPFQQGSLRLQVIRKTEEIVEGLLWTEAGIFYPIIESIPRLIPEAIFDYQEFLREHIPDFDQRLRNLPASYLEWARRCERKNSRTKKSFSMEWSIFDYEKDKTWDADSQSMLQRFLKETDMKEDGLQGIRILDAGCGNGLLDGLLASKDSMVLAMDLSPAISEAHKKNSNKNILFVQGDIDFPPIVSSQFYIVQCSGGLVHTADPKWAFDRMDRCVATGGKLSIWLYHKRKDSIHRLLLGIRKFTSKWPIRLQYYFYLISIFPLSFIVKRLKGNPQNAREIMLQILDFFSPEFRWEFDHNEVMGWFREKGYDGVVITTDELFGFNLTGLKSVLHKSG